MNTLLFISLTITLNRIRQLPQANWPLTDHAVRRLAHSFRHFTLTLLSLHILVSHVPDEHSDHQTSGY